MVSLDSIVNLAKRRGFIFQNSEIYGGQASVYDYGPLGVELKNRIKNLWWEDCVRSRGDMVGLDSAILMKSDVWETSGHLDNFDDPLQECKDCHNRIRVEEEPREACPNCGNKNLTEPRRYNLLFKTSIGPVQKHAKDGYLRPETAQGIFVNFSNVLNSTRQQVPFGIAQIGKAFRNEVTTRSFIFRTLEFEQMEIEYFVEPKQAEEALERWKKKRIEWYKEYGIESDRLRLRRHTDEERAHYAESCFDVEYQFPSPLGWSELEGVANRTDYDLKKHQEESGTRMSYYDQEREEHIIPHVIEPSAGVDRALLAFLFDAYKEEEVDGNTRNVLSLDPRVAPFKMAVFPLMSNRDELVRIARSIADDLQEDWHLQYDDSGSIGKRYRRQDEIGTPYCITVDPDSEEDLKVTVRDRDTMEQDRVAIDQLERYFQDRL